MLEKTDMHKMSLKQYQAQGFIFLCNEIRSND